MWKGTWSRKVSARISEFKGIVFPNPRIGDYWTHSYWYEKITNVNKQVFDAPLVEVGQKGHEINSNARWRSRSPWFATSKYSPARFLSPSSLQVASYISLFYSQNIFYSFFCNHGLEQFLCLAMTRHFSTAFNYESRSFLYFRYSCRYSINFNYFQRSGFLYF